MSIFVNIGHWTLQVLRLSRPAWARAPHFTLRRKKGLGKILLVDAVRRSLMASSDSVASMAVVVDPIDAEAIAFYEKYGFIALLDSNRMFLPMATIAKAFDST